MPYLSPPGRSLRLAARRRAVRRFARATALLTALVVSVAPLPAAAVTGAGAPGEAVAWPPPTPGTYAPPVAAPVVDPFRPPTGPYGPGNRGLEYGVVGGERVVAVADGVVQFAGAVAGRLVVTVVHPDGRRSSLTGLSVLLVVRGAELHRGALLGLAAPGLHLGVREGDRYVDPAELFGTVPQHAWLVPLAVTVPRPIFRAV